MTVLGKRRREDPRGRETELAFLRATEELLDEGASFAELNVTRIAERAERTRTAFYAHFTDRRDLLVRLIDELGGTVFASTEALWQAASTRPELRAIVADTLGTFAAHATLLRAIVEAAGYDDEIARIWEGAVGRFVAAGEERLRSEGRSAQQARATAFALVWMTERTCYQQVVRPGGVPDGDVIEALTDAWWRALMT